MAITLRIFIIVLLSALLACNNSGTKSENVNVASISDTIYIHPKIVECDTFEVDLQPVKDYKKALSVWLKNTSVEWFLENRQAVWREAKAWNTRILTIDSTPTLQCLANISEPVFLYIPSQYYITEKNGNEYFRFFIANNSRDTISIPCLDAVVNNISTSISTPSDSDSKQWLPFQQTDMLVMCGNSRWTMKLAPRNAVESRIESSYIGLGDTKVNYRLELTLDDETYISNSIDVYLMNKQLSYMGKSYD